MVTLNATLRTYRAPQLQRFVAEDLGSADMLDGFAPRVTGGLTHAEGAALLTHTTGAAAGGVAAGWQAVSVKADSQGRHQPARARR